MRKVEVAFLSFHSLCARAAEHRAEDAQRVLLQFTTAQHNYMEFENKQNELSTLTQIRRNPSAYTFRSAMNCVKVRSR